MRNSASTYTELPSNYNAMVLYGVEHRHYSNGYREFLPTGWHLVLPTEFLLTDEDFCRTGTGSRLYESKDRRLLIQAAPSEDALFLTMASSPQQTLYDFIVNNETKTVSIVEIQ